MVFSLLVQWEWGEKAEELVSLRMEGFKNWRRAGLLAPFQLEFDSAVRPLLQAELLCSYAPGVPAAVNV